MRIGMILDELTRWLLPAILVRTPSFCTRCGRCSHDSDNGWTCGSGMILDVTRWLPEHPGGSSIIPLLRGASYVLGLHSLLSSSRGVSVHP